MDMKICQTIKKLRINQNISQATLAQELNVSTQSVSKWENQKALPDIMLLPEIARFFGVSIDTLFLGITNVNDTLPTNIMENLSVNSQAWNQLSAKGWKGTALPNWGVYIPNEDELHLLGDVAGKKVLEIGCGAGRSLVYCGQKHAKELWGIDVSEVQIEKAKQLLDENELIANLYTSPMEVNPGIPEKYFDYVYSVYAIGWTQDLDKTISLAAKYLKTNGSFIFSWDNPMLPCIETINGQYVLNRSYVEERTVRRKQRDESVVMTYWKLSSYINTLAKHGFKVEQLIEESEETEENVVFTDEYYSKHKAQYIHHSFIIKARKL